MSSPLLARVRPIGIAVAAFAVAAALAVPAAQADPSDRGPSGDSAAGPATAHRAASSRKACRIKGPHEEHWKISKRDYHKARGKIRAAMLFVDFPDHPAVAAETPPAAFGASITRFAKDWIKENSYGRASLSVKYFDKWIRMGKRASRYHLDNATFDQHRAYVKEAVKRANRAGFRFGGRSIVYVIAAPTGGDIDQTMALLAGKDWAIKADGGKTRIGWAPTTGDDSRDDDGSFQGQGLAHETMHTLGVPDLYSSTGRTWKSWHRYVGGWDIMGYDMLGMDTLTWHKRQLGWLRKSQWACVGYGKSVKTVVTPNAARGGVKSLMTPYNRSTAYVAEVRTPVGHDSAMCDPDGGVLIYRVNARKASGKGPVRVQPSKGGSTGRCGPLAFAPFDVGQTFRSHGIRVKVLAKVGGGYRIRMTNRR